MKKNLWFFLLMILLLIGLSFCSKEEPVSGDQVLGLKFFLTTDDVKYITCASACSGGYIIDNVGGSGALTALGVCWSTTPNPTIADNKTIDRLLSDQPYFHSMLTGLNLGTTYYVRAYATNSTGITYYGNELHFSSPVVQLPIVVTDTLVIIRTPEEARVGINITDVGCGSITSKGVCWSTSQNPTINDNTVEVSGPSLGVSQCHFAGLEISTTYYLRAFATNSTGTAYGNEVSFTTPPPFNSIIGSVTDVDGNTYKTIQIGTQTWMAENLKTTKYCDGSPIPLGYGAPAGFTDWFDCGDGAYCWFDNDEKNKDTIGAIYNWHAVGTGKLCPTGWHAPTYSEWTTLVTYLGGEEEAFNEKTENAMIHWGSSNNNINESGFTPVFPAGELCGWGFLPSDLWWSATPRPTQYAVPPAYLITFRIIGFEPVSYGYPVRCLKN